MWVRGGHQPRKVRNLTIEGIAEAAAMPFLLATAVLFMLEGGLFYATWADIGVELPDWSYILR
jgi:hypothetical protein